MRSTATQLSMAVDDPAEAEKERSREADDQRLLAERFYAACRAVVRESSWDAVAKELDAIWDPAGRGVSAGVLRATLAPNSERNYFRFEWAIWFARQSDDVADLLAEIIGRGKPKKTPEQELADLKQAIRAELPKRAEHLIRKAATP